MRELYPFCEERSARRLVAVLQSQQMPAVVEEEDNAWIVWIQNDDDREKARVILKNFLADPEALEFAEAEAKAQQKIAEAERTGRQRQKRIRDLRQRWNGVWWKCYPVTMIMIWISVLVVAACTDWRRGDRAMGLFPETCNDESSAVRNALFIQSPAAILSAADGEVAVFKSPTLGKTLLSGQIWRPVTPIFLHFSVLHIFFNMIWLRDLGKSVEFVRGTRRFLPLVLIIAVASNIAQFLWSDQTMNTLRFDGQLYSGAARFGGMSGVVFGLIGYIWIKGKTQPRLGLGLSPDQFVWAVLWMLLCLVGAFGAIANAAHVVGFAVGILIGGRQAIWKQLRRFTGGTPT